ncbi:anthranilate phosphoribosyltransferase [Companilactobacillus nodensis]|uniref:Anthranilate phosphoribosyltransferase n=1 Tax=Companilactobacillus nodensis DSM 19682 = JCM 14932 = NBRC 107160 TaxID=1423775 RepID=A0A0R1K6V7_9LACO|nr:anthranilate phosphoribosyltransferase [Companilactobacillus nodensis]KRK79391.1 anthranilate phosphoribosyltransferase [Companilactobacillus nodensis DSM 19682 = JCM 14932 = NBRC 107160]
MQENTKIEVAIKKLVSGTDLTFEETNQVIDEIMSGKTTPVQISSFLTALSVKKETVEEIAGAADAMRAHALEFKADEPVLEIVGTGGDHSNSFNISTTSALVVSATGIPVAKHGNRAASSKSGAADVLEALGIHINIDPEQSEAVLNEIGICFLFAQEYHKAMKYVAPVRKELGIRTLFNILGPLANPAHATSQLLGVYNEELVEPMAKVLNQLGVKNATVVHGQDGFDEVSASAPTTIAEVIDGKVKKYEITPEEFGIKRCDKLDVIGGTPEENAQITRDVLDGKKDARRYVVLLNSGVAIHTARPDISIAEGIKMAQDAIDSGTAQQQLNRFISLTKVGLVA